MNGLLDTLSPYLQDQRLLFVLIFMCGLLVGWLLTKLSAIRRIATLEAMLQYEIMSAEEKIEAMTQSFAALSQDALQQNNRQFLDLAEQTLSRFNQQAEHNLKDRENAVAQLVQPLNQALNQAKQQFDAFDQNRREAHGALTTQIEVMARQQLGLTSETRNLVQALRRPEVRGQWGEISLRRLVELSGMTAHCDFTEQATSTDNRYRPDMIVNLPGERQIVIDVKTPLDAYLSATAADNQQDQQRYLQAHALQVKKRIGELSAKAYWAQFSEAPDFVVLFIPGDQFLSAALEKNPQLLEQALQQKVILATPTSLVALLRTIANGWTQQKLNSHALEIRDAAEEYHQRLATFSEHLENLGTQLERVVGTYNQSVGSYQRKLMPIAKRFAELGLRKDKLAAEPEPIIEKPIKPL